MTTQKATNNTHIKKYSFLLSCFICVALLLSIITTNPAAAQKKSAGKPYVNVQIIPEFSAFIPGKPLTLAIEQTIQPDWHTYWTNPGDSGEPLRVKWIVPNGFNIGEMQWPVPERIPFGPLMNFGYHDQVTSLAQLDTPEDFSGDSVTITAEVTWLVCADICVPEKTTLTFNILAADNETEINDNEPELFEAARAGIPATVDWDIQAHEEGKYLLIDIQVPENQRKIWTATKEIQFFPDEWGIIQNAAPQKTTATENGLRLKIERDTRSLSDIPAFTGLLAFENDDGSMRGLRVTGFIKNTANTTNGTDTESPATPSNQTEVPVSFGKAILLAMLGGIILNLMPCVFPVLSIKALSLVKMSDHAQSAAIKHGLAYMAGILVCFGLIAGSLIILQQSGAAIGWGFQLQNPAVIIALAYLLFTIGLNLAGVYDVGGSHKLTSIGQSLTGRDGAKGAFFTGMLATIVATPCTAPFMGIALGFALTQPAAIAFTVFMALGIGLGLPYLLLSAIPALRNKLPRPGHWMETFRQALAFPMFASTAWLIWVYAQQSTASDLLWPLLGLVLIGFGIWTWKKAPKKGQKNGWLRHIIHGIAIIALLKAALIIALAASLRPSENQIEHTIINDLEAHAYTKEMFDDALKGNDPIFVNMTAAWCITCKVNERIALSTDRTRTAFAENNVTYIIGDWTNQNPQITEFLARYGRNGVPLYVYFGPRDPVTGSRPEPKLLPQLLTPSMVEDIIQQP